MRGLLEDETLVLTLHRHWALLVRWLALPLLAAAAAVLLAVATSAWVTGDLRLLLVLLALAVLGLWTVVAWFRWASVSVTLTDQRVILQNGVVSRMTKVIALDRVQDVGTSQTALGRLLGYGTVEIASSGAGGAELFGYVPGPNRLRDQIFVQSGISRRTRGS